MKRSLLCLLALLSLAWTNAPVHELKLYTKYSDSAEMFDRCVSVASMTNGVGKFLSATVEQCAAQAAKTGNSAQAIASMRGRWLEWALLVALKERGLTPAWWQEEFEAVPHNFNDVTLWSKEHGPVILSCKTSLRERYKQADLEAVSLKRHFPDALCYLVTLDADKKHLARVRSKIKTGEIEALQGVYDEGNIDELFVDLKKLTLTEPPAKTIRSGTIVR